MYVPQSIGKHAPLIISADVDARKAIVSATSSDVAPLLFGWPTSARYVNACGKQRIKKRNNLLWFFVTLSMDGIPLPLLSNSLKNLVDNSAMVQNGKYNEVSN